MRYVIVDDEEDSRLNLQLLLDRHCPKLEFSASTTNASEARAAIKKYNPDLLFLDIQMPEESGFQLLESLDGKRPFVVFVTAYDEYAVQAIKENALDYILKPIDIKDLENLNKVIEEKLSQSVNSSHKQNIAELLNKLKKKEDERILLPVSEGYELVELNSIAFVKSSSNYSKVYFKEGDQYLLVNKSLKDFEKILPNPDFCRVHASYIINLQFLGGIQKKDGCSVVLKNGQQFPVARRRTSNLLEQLKNLEHHFE